MQTPARSACRVGGAALAAALAVLAGCGLQTGGVGEQDADGSGDGPPGDADGTVGADGDAEPPDAADADVEAEMESGGDADAAADGDADRDADAAGDADGDPDVDVEADAGPTCSPGATRGCEVAAGACGPGVQTRGADGEWGACVDAGPAPEPEICDGLDNDCDTLTDEDLGRTTCGALACRTSVESCVAGVPQTCVPLSPTTCDAPPAPCRTTTTGLDDCGDPCTKVGPDCCLTVHPACLDSSPGSCTEEPTCTTPRGEYNCGLTCEEWPNSIGADCTYCENILCWPRSGPDVAQFRCDNIPVPPTP